MHMKVDCIDKIYLVCENVDEAIDIRDELIDAGIYSTMPSNCTNWVIRIEKPLTEDNYIDLDVIKYRRLIGLKSPSLKLDLGITLE